MIKDAKESKNTESKPKKLSYKEKLEYENLENEIETLERTIKDIESKLSNPKEYEKHGIATLSYELETTKSTLESKWQRYEELSLKMENL